MYKLSPFKYKFSEKIVSSQSEFVLPDHGLVLISGPSGGGKSTFLKILKGIIPEYSTGILEGSILFQNRPLTGLNFQENLKKILYLFQNPFSQLIYPTTEEEFLFSMENFNFTKAQMTEAKEKFERIFGLEKLWGKKTSELSNGECQKLVLASMLTINPEVLLLDEPTAFLDPKARDEFYKILAELKKERLVILVDHHDDEVSSIVDRRLFVSSNGEVSETLHASHTDNQPLQLNNLVSFQGLNLELKNISFSYDKKPLLENVSATFNGGEVISISGTNGVGKSTLFKLMAGIISPKNGEVEMSVGGKKFKNKKNFINTGFIFQNPETHFFFDSIEEELKQSFKNLKSDELKQKLITTFFHNIDLKKSPFLLSEGEKRRLSILMTVFLGKGLLLYDEPTFGQDQESIERIESLITELKKLGIIQIIISHDEGFIQKMSDKKFILKDRGLHAIS